MIPIEKFRRAASIIGKKIIRTPLVYSPTLSRMFDAQVYLKLENLQKTGSFKIRGATHKLLAVKEKIGSGGVVAASAGNHAQGVALAAAQLGIPATIVMPEQASITKQEATRGYGGEVVIFGKSVEESLGKAQELAQSGKTFIHPFDDVDIIIGQGTIALEVFEDLRDPDMIVAPVGGGGFMSGIASVAKCIRPETEIIGVQAAACPSVFESCRQGKVTRVVAKPSIADGISIKQVGVQTFDIIRKLVDDMVLVEEAQIAAAILTLLERKKILAEGSGAVPLAALLNGSVSIPRGSKVVLLISGGNLDSTLLGRIISQGLLKNGRVMRIQVCLNDTPGSLAELLVQIARLKANVLHIYHDRNVRDLPIYVTRVDLELETRGPEHVDEIVGFLQEKGCKMELSA